MPYRTAGSGHLEQAGHALAQGTIASDRPGRAATPRPNATPYVRSAVAPPLQQTPSRSPQWTAAGTPETDHRAALANPMHHRELRTRCRRSRPCGTEQLLATSSELVAQSVNLKMSALNVTAADVSQVFDETRWHVLLG